MINGIVLLNIPDELAWSLYFDSRNVLAIGTFTGGLQRAYAIAEQHPRRV